MEAATHPGERRLERGLLANAAGCCMVGDVTHSLTGEFWLVGGSLLSSLASRAMGCAEVNS
jgi:hypothetical protein